jgi:hypothetical protein
MASRLKLPPEPKAPKSRVIRRLPVTQQLELLERRDIIKLLGAERCADLRRKALHHRGTIARVVPSFPWLIEAEERGHPFPIPGMVLSGAFVRIGDGPATRRYTPGPAVEEEDRIDGAEEADLYRICMFPSSCSAAAIEQIRIRGARPINGGRIPR